MLFEWDCLGSHLFNGLKMIASWIVNEFQSLNLGDARLDRRAKRCVQQYSKIAESTPDACQNLSAVVGTYRLADNPKAGMLDILGEHNRATIERVSQQSLVYVAQDTSVFDLTKPKRQVVGAGPLENENHFGFFYHPAFAFNGDGIALGSVDQCIWSRDQINTGMPRREKEQKRKQACFEEKESYRWLEMQQNAEQIARANPQTEIIMLADSEADVGELFCDANDFPRNFHLLIRGCQNRAVTSASEQIDSQSAVSITGCSNIDEALAKAQWRCHETIEIGTRESMIANELRPRLKSRDARTAQIAVRAITATLRGSHRAGGNLPDVTLNVVEAVEQDCPSGAEPVRWVLLTTLPVSSATEIKFALKSYGMRWGVELYFKTLKSGLHVEKLKYRTLDRYLTVFAMLAIVAYRVEYLKTAARAQPQAPCEAFFDKHEWVPVYLYANKTRAIPDDSPTIAEFLLLTAILGGYLNRKSQGPPGSTTIWRGMQRMDTIVEAYQVFGET
jgi:hypothetical protein